PAILPSEPCHARLRINEVHQSLDLVLRTRRERLVDQCRHEDQLVPHRNELRPRLQNPVEKRSGQSHLAARFLRAVFVQEKVPFGIYTEKLPKYIQIVAERIVGKARKGEIGVKAGTETELPLANHLP